MTPSAARVRIPRAVGPLLRRIGCIAQAQGQQAYAVGGCVRDWLLGRHTRDVDIVVDREAARLARAVADALGGRLTIHAQFGTATVATRTRTIDVATCRRESYAVPAAYPKVRPGTLRQDLFRRDFTINAMACRLAPAAWGRLVDEFGGRRDLTARRLRVLHPRSFIDDPSRILRAVRFEQRLGLTIEPRTRRWMREAIAAGWLLKLNRGRWRKELSAMDEEPRHERCVQRLAGLLIGDLA
ncbi:MAG: CCA tRNA nucleotidyltransferase [Candidatus Omnitrophica bacterium]|nr:CCA tRNA nucleotidyltransferase [Candidatus Omnitrophota bacterium]